MTTADLARWERMAQGDWMGPEGKWVVMVDLIAEVRRLRALAVPPRAPTKYFMGTPGPADTM